MSTATKLLEIPDSLTTRANPERQLPQLSPDIKETAARLGWVGVGIMVALVTERQDVMMLVGRETAKYRAGTLGPLGETSKQIDGLKGMPPLVEQPLSTLHRGLSEELGVTEPERLGLKMAPRHAWEINAWPRGDAYPGQLNCAVSFAVHLSSDAEAYLREINPRNDEVDGVQVVSVDDVLRGHPSRFRQGVQPWLMQLQESGLLTPSPDLTVVDFDSVMFGSKDIQIDVE